MSLMRNPILSHTHTSPDKLSKSEITQEMKKIHDRLSQQFESEPEKRDAFLKTLEELSEFELGRFLIKNKGALSGYWTWYIILGFNNHQATSILEKFMLEKAPVLLATRERFAVFQTLLTKHITSNSVVCSIPCGMMADLLTLQLPENIKDIRFVGIDLDEMTCQLARDLAKQTRTSTHCDFFQKDAWDLNLKNEFDIITTNGLNIYEKDDTRVVALYRGLYNALKVNGTLICSALSTPPSADTQTEWDMSKIDQTHLQTAGVIFSTVLEATWANFRSSDKTCAQLKEAGFEDIEIHWDCQRIFPTFSARKAALRC